MIILPDGTSVIDTPGLREFGLMDITPEMLGKYFYDFSKYDNLCGFSPCSHDHEPKCEIKNRVEAGKIFAERYVSYLNILQSLIESRDSRYK
jgi:ribosome biogenesis GTPase